VQFYTELEEAGTLIMSIQNSDEHVKDELYSCIVVMLNASAEDVDVPYPPCLVDPEIHPALDSLPHVASSSLDHKARTAAIAARTLLVLCQRT
jgi:hypothetical protein